MPNCLKGHHCSVRSCWFMFLCEHSHRAAETLAADCVLVWGVAQRITPALFENTGLGGTDGVSDSFVNTLIQWKEDHCLPPAVQCRWMWWSSQSNLFGLLWNRENPRDGAAWWAAVSGVAQSRTRLKRLSSSSHNYTHWSFALFICWKRKLFWIPFTNK